ncbi:MAG: hypothetical protein IPM56_11420 [Ignavibacteriales bacterium]|nr:MAG: hypothetical protein IPM56_11420 [Ignavibacteriales bacterium]
MKNKILYLSILTTLFLFNACDINDSYFDYTPPAEPRNIVVLNGDNRVDLYWDDNREGDLAGYNVYYAYSYDGKYTLIGSTSSNYFIDDGASNGLTLYYAVTAYDYNGNESELSVDVVYATPRPEGFNQAIFDFRRFPDNSGYSFSDYLVVPFDDNDADFFFENYQGTFYLDVYNDTDIRDMGPTNDIYDIPFAPTSGWSSTKDEIARVGHTYVIWTWDNHYAKIRVKAITGDRIVFDWAYQLVEGNRELKLKAVPDERGPLSRSNRTRTEISSNQ